MKKLQKISINPEKLIKNDELVNLRGGYDDPMPCENCACYDSSYNLLGPYILNTESPTGCRQACIDIYGIPPFLGHKCE